MITYVVFDTGNENYKEIRSNLPMGRTHSGEQKTLYRYPAKIFKERSYLHLNCTKTFCIHGKTFQDSWNVTIRCYYSW